MAGLPSLLTCSTVLSQVELAFGCFGRIRHSERLGRLGTHGGNGVLVDFLDKQAAALAFRAFQDQHFSAAAYMVLMAMLYLPNSLAVNFCSELKMKDMDHGYAMHTI